MYSHISLAERFPIYGAWLRIIVPGVGLEYARTSSRRQAESRVSRPHRLEDGCAFSVAQR